MVFEVLLQAQNNEVRDIKNFTHFNAIWYKESNLCKLYLYVLLKHYKQLAYTSETGLLGTKVVIVWHVSNYVTKNRLVLFTGGALFKQEIIENIILFCSNNLYLRVLRWDLFCKNKHSQFRQMTLNFASGCRQC